MRHHKIGRQLSRNSSHRKATLQSLSTALIKHGIKNDLVVIQESLSVGIEQVIMHQWLILNLLIDLKHQQNKLHHLSKTEIYSRFFFA